MIAALAIKIYFYTDWNLKSHKHLDSSIENMESEESLVEEIELQLTKGKLSQILSFFC